MFAGTPPANAEITYETTGTTVGLVQSAEFSTSYLALLAQAALYYTAISTLAPFEYGVMSTKNSAALFTDAETFIEKNADKIVFDMAKGEGEYLDALGDLLEVPTDLRPAWHKEMQKRYAVLAKKG